jgi:hypothetical protein
MAIKVNVRAVDVGRAGEGQKEWDEKKKFSHECVSSNYQSSILRPSLGRVRRKRATKEPHRKYIG